MLKNNVCAEKKTHVWVLQVAPLGAGGTLWPCRGVWPGLGSGRAAVSQALREAAVQNPGNQTKRKQANKKALLQLQLGTRDSKQRRLKSQYILPLGNQLCPSQEEKKFI